MANEFVAKNGLISQNNSTVSGSLTVTQGITGSFSGSVAGYVASSQTSSFVQNSQTSSFATTGSNNFVGNQTITGSLIISGSSTQLQIGSNILLITGSTGNVLVNTTTDAGFKLDVNGTARIQGATTISTGNLTVSSGNTLIGTTTDLGYRLSISGSGTSGSLRIAPSFTATNMTASSVILITGSIQQIQTASAQIYAVNIAPTMVFTTGSQTNTVFRVAPTFSGSAAFTSSQNNIIADFGATAVGTQFSVNDITSGSIYMVNDVSGLPIIEALSDWTVNIYNYPTKIFQKTGSAIIITGSMSITGSLTMSPTSSFVLPLTSSISPATGSIYWSGSLLFIYNGTRYMSASFA